SLIGASTNTAGGLPGGWFETDPNQGVNLMLNPGQTGTGGSKDANTTGSLSDSWQVLRSTGAVATAVASKSNLATGIDATTLTFTLSGAESTLQAWQYNPGGLLAMGNSGTAKAVTVTVLAAGADPRIQV